MAKRQSKFDLSKAAFGEEVRKADPNKVVMLPLGAVHSNSKNFYSLDGIEELAESIKLVGLMEPVRVVRYTEKSYRLISGHRRLRAYRYLHEQNGRDFAEIPALVMEDMDALTETFALVTANSTARELTYAEKCRQEKELREVLTAWKAAGKEVPKNLGQYIADQIGTSRNEVSRMHSVNEHLIPEARARLDAGEMTAQQAYELSRKPEEIQRASVSNLDTKPQADAAAETQRKAADAPKAQQDAVGALADKERRLDILAWAKTILPDWCADAHMAPSRGDCIEALKRERRNQGRWHGNDADCDTFGGKIKLKIGGREISWAEAWDALAIAALQRVSRPPEPEKPQKSAGAGWHTEDPAKNDDYITMYRTPSGDVSAGILTWRGQWRKYGQPVGDVYKVLKWTEVPK